MLVAGMAAHTDISKAHEIANQVRRIHKDLKDAQTDAAKYNNRERLFGMPSGYVLEFSNRTFEEFFIDRAQINIYNSKYN